MDIFSSVACLCGARLQKRDSRTGLQRVGYHYEKNADHGMSCIILFINIAFNVDVHAV